MRQGKRLSLAGWTAGIVAAFAGGAAWSQTAPDHPAITFKGETYTPALILSRNMGTVTSYCTSLSKGLDVGLFLHFA
jgi:hypothetical protein